MDEYTFILNMVGVVGGLVILSLTLYLFGIRPQTKKLIAESQRLQLKLNQLRRDMGPGEDGRGFVGEAIGEIGIEGILDELGVPKPFQGIAKGFIDGILKDPKKLQSIADKFGVKIPGADNNEPPNILL